MARFDVYRLNGGEFVLDCQSDLMAHYNTRLVVPLRRPEDAPLIAARLNPKFNIAGEGLVMVTQFAGAMLALELGETVASLANHDSEILSALDMLISGF